MNHSQDAGSAIDAAAGDAYAVEVLAIPEMGRRLSAGTSGNSGSYRPAAPGRP